MRNILVAMDASEGAMRAVDHVRRMVSDRSDEFRVTLFHATRGASFLSQG